MNAYNRSGFLLGSAQLDFGPSGSDLRVMLATTSYVPDLDHDFVSSVVAAELSGGNYVRKALASKTWTLSDAADASIFTAANVVWSALLLAAGTPRYAVVFKQVTNDADSPLVSVAELPATPPTGSDYTVQWDASGIYRIEHQEA